MLLLMAPAGGQGGGNIFGTLGMFAAVIFIFYFLILRPQQKRAAEQKKLLASVKKGDRVVMSSGIHGTIVGVEDDSVLVQVADNVKVKFEKHSVSTVKASE